MIKLHNVSKTYTLKNKKTVTAVQEIDLEVKKGEFVIITGRSGSGKTTLLNLAAGLATPSTGQVLLDGVEVWKLADSEQALLRNEKIGFVFQFPSLLPTLTTMENVVLPTIFGKKQAADEAHARAVQLLADVGLSHRMESYPRQLSGGEQQRVVIARSLINHPELLLADEPTSDLDEHTEEEIMTLFQDIHAKTGVTILLVTHASELVRFGTRAVKMAGGKILSPEVEAVYRAA